MQYEGLKRYIVRTMIHKVFEKLYGSYTISEENETKMNQYLGITTEELEAVNNSISEYIKCRAIPLVPKYQNKACYINGYRVSKHTLADQGGGTIQILTERLIDYRLPQELQQFGAVVAYLIVDDYTDQILDQWQTQGITLADVANIIGKPADVLAAHKLSKLQKEILINIRHKALKIRSYAPPHTTKVPWNASELAPSTHRAHASRCLRELQKRGLLKLHGEKRTTHVQLTPTATALLIRLLETGNNK
ncbi:MAG: hypothetical protein NZL92_10410 [Gloeomargarita sp. SKYG116]|nr:hypothetical protein [Gloeomargarita sp. SKYG116]MCS7225977.1 hypothetical protein [Gloeomargarita sp. SKYB31]MDW8402094.1 hypothetical protein [Gloeomargarita sp. SKYGB_i_bin116]